MYVTAPYQLMRGLAGAEHGILRSQACFIQEAARQSGDQRAVESGMSGNHDAQVHTLYLSYCGYRPGTRETAHRILAHPHAF